MEQEKMQLNPEVLRQMREQTILLAHYKQTAEFLERSIMEKLRLVTGWADEQFVLDLEAGEVAHGS